MIHIKRISLIMHYHVCALKHACMCACICVCVCACTCVSFCMSLYMYVCVCLCACECMCVHTCVGVSVCVCTVVVCWYFEPSQPQWITPGLKQTSICILFTLHTSHQTTNSPKTTKSVPTQIYIKQNIHKHQTQNVQGIDDLQKRRGRTLSKCSRAVRHSCPAQK